MCTLAKAWGHVAFELDIMRSVAWQLGFCVSVVWPGQDHPGIYSFLSVGIVSVEISIYDDRHADEAAEAREGGGK